MLLMDNRIKIYTRSANIELYRYSQKLIDLPYKCVRLYGTTADGYFYQMLDDKDCDIAINIDEDAFVVNNAALKALLDYVIANDIVCCGMNDGGVLPIRVGHPVIMNPFFNIINLKAIREKFNREEIEHFSFQEHKDELLAKLPPHLRNYHGEKTDNEHYEPYYSFFFWLALTFKIEFLPVEEHPDGYTTILCNQENQPMLYHTWWSRAYGVDAFHTERIKNVIKEAYVAQSMSVPCLFFTKIWRWFEYKSQQFQEWWTWWTRLGFGNWIIRHAKKSPKHYFNAIQQKIRH